MVFYILMSFILVLSISETISNSVTINGVTINDETEIEHLKRGIDGITVVKYKPCGEEFIKFNKVFYKCDGEISSKDGKCVGFLRKFNFNKDADFCFADKTAESNDHICFITYPTSHYAISVSNNLLTCAGDKSLLIPKSKYKDMCGYIATSAIYTYFPKNGPIKDSNVTCSNDEPIKCLFEEANRLNSSGYYLRLGTNTYYLISIFVLFYYI